jgi:hydroxymethylglutaryl-CoA reductase (NADPH)
MKIPQLILRQLYTFGSLENVAGGVRFDLKNRLSDARLTDIHRVRIGDADVPLDRVTLDLGTDGRIQADGLANHGPIPFPLRRTIQMHAGVGSLDKGKHEVVLEFTTEPFGKLTLKVSDAVSDDHSRRVTVPYDKENDYTDAMAARRHDFVKNFSGVDLEHVPKYSIDVGATQGNVENFLGTAQIPIGLAGPIEVHGEHAQGEFLAPLATTEGTLVASYNRGIKTLNLSGGVRCTVLDDRMQRAPVFVFSCARQARDFRNWVEQNMDEIRRAAEETSSVAKLLYIETYLAHRFAFLRFNYSTGDAAGQNMVGRATFAACSWILDHRTDVERFYLESNLATDKKASQVNVMRTRGKRVVAECTIPHDVLVQNMRVEPEAVFFHYNVANVGAFLSGANNNGCHSPNAITALFIATGQDVANVSESSAANVYAEVREGGDLYMSLTIPSLIVATYGGGTGLPTQRECLELMGCYGRGKVQKFAEIVAGVALAGEISLASAISSLDWVSSHEKYGRNR